MKTTTQVTHSQFGNGTILSNDSKTVVVNFNGQEKNLVIKFANLKTLNGSTWKPAKVKVVQTKTYSFNELCKEDQDFLMRTGVYDRNGNLADSDMDVLVSCYAAKKTGEWA